MAARRKPKQPPKPSKRKAPPAPPGPRGWAGAQWVKSPPPKAPRRPAKAPPARPGWVAERRPKPEPPPEPPRKRPRRPKPAPPPPTLKRDRNGIPFWYDPRNGRRTKAPGVGTKAPVRPRVTSADELFDRHVLAMIEAGRISGRPSEIGRIALRLEHEGKKPGQSRFQKFDPDALQRFLKGSKYANIRERVFAEAKSITFVKRGDDGDEDLEWEVSADELLAATGEVPDDTEYDDTDYDDGYEPDDD